MSVTFYPEPGPIDHYTVECLSCGITHDTTFATHGEALDFHDAVVAGTAHVTGCIDRFGDCPDAAAVVAQEADGSAPSVNVSNVNARHVLSLLGAEPDDELVGCLPAEDVLGRALIALAVAPADEGIPAHEVPGPGALLVDCGRPPGYSEGRLRQIVEVAEWARDHNRQVQWD